jgi:hypothetical protein
MAVGNTFGATALSSYGGFWLSFAIILTPGGFNIQGALEEMGMAYFYNSFGLYLFGWFIFTFILLICTLRSTVAFFSLFFTLDIAFMMLGIGYLQHDGVHPNSACIKAGGYFGLFAAFLAWYNALAGIADNSNRSVVIIVCMSVTYANRFTASSSSPSHTSPGARRAARGAARSTPLLPPTHKGYRHAPCSRSVPTQNDSNEIFNPDLAFFDVCDLRSAIGANVFLLLVRLQVPIMTMTSMMEAVRRCRCCEMIPLGAKSRLLYQSQACL